MGTGTVCVCVCVCVCVRVCSYVLYVCVHAYMCVLGLSCYRAVKAVDKVVVACKNGV